MNTTSAQFSKQLREWYRRPFGQLLASAEQKELDQILPNLFGYHLLQIGVGGHGLMSASRILHKVMMTIETVGSESLDKLSGDHSSSADSVVRDSEIKGYPESMPIAPDSVDALLLNHALECADDPHQVLRESERILVPEGNIVIMGFNPISLWGLLRLLRFRSKKVPWCCRVLTIRRIRDWLALLGFEVTLSRQFFFRPPVQHQGIMSRLQCMEKWGALWWPFFGSVYVLTARKKVSTMTPLKPRWRPRRSLVSGLADTASRNGVTGSTVTGQTITGSTMSNKQEQKV